ncbi:MAG TPA: PRC-barrel domain-containing protein [Azospirillaceae bacterium]|nr:PRC-barrel domain-containing protein [Azospirillaceae bacterium]
MRTTLIGAVSALALLSGGAFAADAAKPGQQPTGWTSLNGLVGKSIVDAQDKEIGEVEDLVLDQQGKVHAVVDLEDNDKDVAIDAAKLKAAAKGDNLTLQGVDGAQLAAMSGFEYSSDRASLTQRAAATQERQQEQRQAGEQAREDRKETQEAAREDRKEAQATAREEKKEIQEARKDADEKTREARQEAREETRESRDAAGRTAAAVGGAAGAATGAAAGEVALGGDSLAKIIGQSVYDAKGNELGEVEDVILDQKGGKAKQVVLDLEGNDKDVALDMTKLSKDPQNQDRWVLQGGDKAQLEAMAKHEYDQNSVSLKADK